MNVRTSLLSVCFGVALLLSFSCERVLAQSEKLGQVQYTPPQGWSRSAKDYAVVFSTINQTAGTFCFITIYAASPTSGNPATDFTREWSSHLIQPWNADPNPKTETTVEDGWTAVAGAAPIDFNGNKALALLTAISGFGKTVSVLGVFNDQSYLAQYTAFVDKLDIDKSNQTTPAQKPALQFDDYGHLLIPPPTRQLTMADIVGQWGESDGINERYVNRYTGAYAGADSLHYKSKMTFSSDGAYYDDFYAIQNGKMIKEKTAGSVAISGRVLLIKSRNLSKYVIRGWLELPNMTILEVCGPWYGDDVIPQEIFNNPLQGANLDKKWVRMK